MTTSAAPALSGSWGASFTLPDNTVPIMPCAAPSSSSAPATANSGSSSRGRIALMTLATASRTIGTLASSPTDDINVLKQQQAQQQKKGAAVTPPHVLMTAAGNLSRKIEHIIVAEGCSSFGAAASAGGAASSSSPGVVKRVVLALSKRNRGFWAVAAITPLANGAFSCVDLSDGFDSCLREACGISPTLAGALSFFRIEGASLCQAGERIAFVVRNSMMMQQQQQQQANGSSAAAAGPAALIVGSLGGASWSVLHLPSELAFPLQARIVTAWTACNTCTVAFARLHPVVVSSGQQQQQQHLSTTSAMSPSSSPKSALSSWFREGVDRRSLVAPTQSHPQQRAQQQPLAITASASKHHGGGGHYFAGTLPVCVVLQFAAVTVSRVSLRPVLSNKGTIRSKAFSISSPLSELPHPLLRFHRCGVRLAAVIDGSYHLADIPTTVWAEGGTASCSVAVNPSGQHYNPTTTGAGTVAVVATTAPIQSASAVNSSTRIDFVGTDEDPVAFFLSPDMAAMGGSGQVVDCGDKVTLVAANGDAVLNLAARDIVGCGAGPARFPTVLSEWLLVQSGPHCAAIAVSALRQRRSLMVATMGAGSAALLAAARRMGSSSGGGAIEMREPACVNFFSPDSNLLQSPSTVQGISHEMRQLDACAAPSSVPKGGDIEHNSVFAALEHIAAAPTAQARLQKIKDIAAACVTTTTMPSNNSNGTSNNASSWVIHVATGHESTIRTLGMIALGTAVGVPVYVTGTTASGGIHASLWAAPSGATMIVPPFGGANNSTSSSVAGARRRRQQQQQQHQDASLFSRGTFQRHQLHYLAQSVSRQLGELSVDLLACVGDLPLGLVAAAHFSRNSVAASLVDLCCGNQPLLAHLIHAAETVLGRVDRAFAARFALCTNVRELLDALAARCADPLNEADCGALMLAFLAVNTPEWFASLATAAASTNRGGGASSNSSSFAVLASPIAALALWVHATRIHQVVSFSSSSSSEAIDAVVSAAADFVRLQRNMLLPLFPMWQQAVTTNPQRHEKQQQQQQQQQQQIKLPTAIDYVALSSLRLISLSMRAAFLVQSIKGEAEQLRRCGGGVRRAGSANETAPTGAVTALDRLHRLVDEFQMLRQDGFFVDAAETAQLELQLLNAVLAVAVQWDLPAASSVPFTSLAVGSTAILNAQEDPAARRCFLELMRRGAIDVDDLLDRQAAHQRNLRQIQQQREQSREVPFVCPVGRGATSNGAEAFSLAHIHSALFPQRAARFVTRLEERGNFWVDLRAFVLCEVVAASAPDPHHSDAPPLLFSVLCDSLAAAVERRVEVRAALPLLPNSARSRKQEQERLAEERRQILEDEDRRVQRRMQLEQLQQQNGATEYASPQRRPASAAPKAAPAELNDSSHHHHHHHHHAAAPAHHQSAAAAATALQARQPKQQQLSQQQAPEELPLSREEQPAASIVRQGTGGVSYFPLDTVKEDPGPIGATYTAEDVAWWEGMDQFVVDATNTAQHFGAAASSSYIVPQQDPISVGAAATSAAAAAATKKKSGKHHKEGQSERGQGPAESDKPMVDLARAKQSIRNALGDDGISSSSFGISPSSTNDSDDTPKMEFARNLHEPAGMVASPHKLAAQQRQQQQQQLPKLLHVSNNIMFTTAVAASAPMPRTTPAATTTATIGGGGVALLRAPPTSSSAAPFIAPHSALPLRPPGDGHEHHLFKQALQHSASRLAPPPTAATTVASMTCDKSAAKRVQLLHLHQQQQQQGQHGQMIGSGTLSSVGLSYPRQQQQQVTLISPMKSSSSQQQLQPPMVPPVGATVSDQQQQQQQQQQQSGVKQTSYITATTSAVVQAAATTPNVSSCIAQRPANSSRVMEEDVHTAVAFRSAAEPLPAGQIPREHIEYLQQKWGAAGKRYVGNSNDGDVFVEMERRAFAHHVSDINSKYGNRPAGDENRSHINQSSSAAGCGRSGISNNNGKCNVCLDDVERVVARQNALLEQSLARHKIDGGSGQSYYDRAQNSSSNLDNNNNNNNYTLFKGGGGAGGPQQQPDSSSLAQHLAQANVSWRDAALQATQAASMAQAKNEIALAELRGMLHQKQADLDRRQLNTLGERVGAVTSMEAVGMALAGGSASAGSRAATDVEQSLLASRAALTESVIAETTNTLSQFDAVKRSLAMLSETQRAAAGPSFGAVSFGVASAEFNAAANPMMMNIHGGSASATQMSMVPQMVSPAVRVELNSEVMRRSGTGTSGWGLPPRSASASPHPVGNVSGSGTTLSRSSAARPGSASSPKSVAGAATARSPSSRPSPKSTSGALTPRPVNNNNSSASRVAAVANSIVDAKRAASHLRSGLSTPSRTPATQSAAGAAAVANSGGGSSSARRSSVSEATLRRIDDLAQSIGAAKSAGGKT